MSKLAEEVPAAKVFIIAKHLWSAIVGFLVGVLIGHFVR